MIVPVPCRFALLLKLLTRIFPWTSDPVVVGTMATPYGIHVAIAWNGGSNNFEIPSLRLDRKEGNGCDRQQTQVSHEGRMHSTNSLHSLLLVSDRAQGKVRFLPCQVTAVANMLRLIRVGNCHSLQKGCLSGMVHDVDSP
jgi:hypothetical protein